MIPNVTRGGKTAGLMSYLVGDGRENEHENQRLIAGDDVITFNVGVGTALDRHSAFEIAALLDEPQRAFGTNVSVPVYAVDPQTGEQLRDERGRLIREGSRDAHVWHCSLSLAADEGKISDAQWQRIAEGFVEKMGFVDPDGAKSSRWVAVHHGASKNGNDHIHIVVQMVREDGTKANVHNDMHRSQKAARELEKEFGLAQLESAEIGRGLSGEKPAERTRAEKDGSVLSDRFELRRRMRAVMANSRDMNEFVRGLAGASVHVAPSFARGSTTQLRGYKVSLGKGESGKQVWYAPSKLDASLGWPQLGMRFKDRGKAEAEQYVASRHTSAQVERAAPSRLRHFTPEQLERMISRPTSPDTLANVYARVSLELEAGRPGAFAQLSEQMARVSQGRGNVMYAVRLQQRFGSRSAETGWLAVTRQANRLARVMVQGKVLADKPRLAAASAATLVRVDASVAAAAARIQERTHTRPPATVVQRRPSAGRDGGYGR